MNLFNQNYHIEIHMHKLQLQKKKKVGYKKDSMERPLVNIYKFWNFDNRFLVGKTMVHVLLIHLLLLYLKQLIRIDKLLSLYQLKVRYMLHVFFKHLLLLCLKKLIRTNRLFSLSTKN